VGQTKEKWISSGKWVGLGALFLLFPTIWMFYIEAYKGTNGLSLMVVLVSFFIFFLFSAIKTWKTVSRLINYPKSNQGKLERANRLKELYQQDIQLISDFLRNRSIHNELNTKIRYGITVTKFDLINEKLLIILQYPKDFNWGYNSIELRGGIFSDSDLISELKEFIDDRIP
jgi:hypothetical protein